MSAGAQRDQKRTLGSSKLELQVFVDCLACLALVFFLDLPEASYQGTIPPAPRVMLIYKTLCLQI